MIRIKNKMIAANLLAHGYTEKVSDETICYTYNELRKNVHLCSTYFNRDRYILVRWLMLGREVKFKNKTPFWKMKELVKTRIQEVYDQAQNMGILDGILNELKYTVSFTLYNGDCGAYTAFEDDEYKECILEFNPILLMENPKLYIEGVVPHEVIHHISDAVYQKSTCHGKLWKDMMVRMGYEPNIYTNVCLRRVIG